MLSNHFILSHSLLLLPSIFPKHKGIFQWVNSSHQVAKVLALQLQHQPFQWIFMIDFLSVQFNGSDMSNSCDPMDCSMPGFPVHHQLRELAQIHVHWLISDAIQISHPLSSPSTPTFNLSQHQGLFWWVSSSHQVAKVSERSSWASILPMNIQDWFALG